MKDGGPAFPISGGTFDVTDAWPFKGMSLRDYIAIHCGPDDYEQHRKPHPHLGESLIPIEYARYAFADAMLKARGKSND